MFNKNKYKLKRKKNNKNKIILYYISNKILYNKIMGKKNNVYCLN